MVRRILYAIAILVFASSAPTQAGLESADQTRAIHGGKRPGYDLDYRLMSDEQILLSLCKLPQTVCIKLVRMARERYGIETARVVQAVRNKRPGSSGYSALVSKVLQELAKSKTRPGKTNYYNSNMNYYDYQQEHNTVSSRPPYYNGGPTASHYYNGATNHYHGQPDYYGGHHNHHDVHDHHDHYDVHDHHDHHNVHGHYDHHNIHGHQVHGHVGQGHQLHGHQAHGHHY